MISYYCSKKHVGNNLFQSKHVYMMAIVYLAVGYQFLERQQISFQLPNSYHYG